MSHSGKEWALETRAVHAGRSGGEERPEWSWQLTVPPIHPSVTCVYERAEDLDAAFATLFFPLNFGFLPTAPPHGAPGRFRGPKKKIVFHCGGEAAAMKNAFFLFFSPRRKRVLAISPPRSPKGQTSGNRGGEGGQNGPAEGEVGSYEQAL